MSEGRDSDIRVLEAEPRFSDEVGRGAFKFGAAVATALTLCHVRVRVENRRGDVADGWGAIFLSHHWAFPSAIVSAAEKDAAMRRITEALCAFAMQQREFGHPVDLFRVMTADLDSVRTQICHMMGLAEMIPRLGALVCLSPVDAALHDAFGVVNRISTYAGYGPDHCRYDLSADLGPAYRGMYVRDFLREEQASKVTIAHTVGGLDALLPGEVPADAPQDGRPNALTGWIEREGVYCFKVKLRGVDLPWDLDRYRSVYRIARETTARQGIREIFCSVDANEQCSSPDYMIEFLNETRASDPEAYTALGYIEQPTERDLYRHRYDMTPLAALKPVIIDESMTRLTDLDVAIVRGWTGVALKTCKCHTLALLLAARAEREGLTYMVQDLTNPGIATVHSLGLAARIRSPLAVEVNARQYYPDTSLPEAAVHPGIFSLTDGRADTATVRGSGLGFQIACVKRPIFRQPLQR